MKTINFLTAAIITTALLLTFSANSYSSEAACHCCDATCVEAGCCTDCGSSSGAAGCCTEKCENAECKECCKNGQCSMKTGSGINNTQTVTGNEKSCCTDKSEVSTDKNCCR